MLILRERRKTPRLRTGEFVDCLYKGFEPVTCHAICRGDRYNLAISPVHRLSIAFSLTIELDTCLVYNSNK